MTELFSGEQGSRKKKKKLRVTTKKCGNHAAIALVEGEEMCANLTYVLCIFPDKVSHSSMKDKILAPWVRG